MNENERSVVKIQVPHTNFYVQGEQKESGLWDAYMVDPQSNLREQIKKNATTKSFVLFSGITLKTQFPLSAVKYHTKEEKERSKLNRIFNENPDIKRLILDGIITTEITKALIENRFYIKDR